MDSKLKIIVLKSQVIMTPLQVPTWTLNIFQRIGPKADLWEKPLDISILDACPFRLVMSMNKIDGIEAYNYANIAVVCNCKLYLMHE